MRWCRHAARRRVRVCRCRAARGRSGAGSAGQREDLTHRFSDEVVDHKKKKKEEEISGDSNTIIWNTIQRNRIASHHQNI